MPPALHRFEQDGKYYALDPETCFCFECDAISWDVVEYYPQEPANRILHLLQEKHPVKELGEVIGELEWLRASKSILSPPKHDQLSKLFDMERGLKQVTVVCGAGEAATKTAWWAGRKDNASFDPAILLSAADLLFARSEGQKTLCLECVVSAAVLTSPEFAAACAALLKKAPLSGKQLLIAVRVETPELLQGHAVAARLELSAEADLPRHFKALAGADLLRLGKLAKVLHPGESGVSGRIILQPNHARFAEAVAECAGAGLRHIEIDIDRAFFTHPDLDPAQVSEGMKQTAVHYAERLLQNQYFRVDPIAVLFWRIYNGMPLRRQDPAGLNTLAVDADGGIYPARAFVDRPEFRLGSLKDYSLDDAALRRFDDIGALTTSVCLRCWARNLCGGGTASVHHALSGSFRRPHEPWCDAQRLWMENAVAAFSRLSSQGVNFTRVYNALDQRARPSLFALVRAAFRMNIGMRPIEEADAEWLTRWENWNEAAYFTCHESSLLMATKYDREMDSLHPLGFEQEFVLLRKNGDPMGLLKVRPDRLPGCAYAWIYLRNPADYADEGVRKSFRTLLGEAAKQQRLRRIVTPAGPSETALAAFLRSTGFEESGNLREALYLHGRYQDVRLFTAALDEA